MIALPARDDAYDYEFFGKQCDAIILMNYDQHWLTSPPGPIAAQDWFVENLKQVMEDVPAQKIIVQLAVMRTTGRKLQRKRTSRRSRSPFRKLCCTLTNPRQAGRV